MTAFEPINSNNASLRYDIKHYESRLRGLKPNCSLDLLASIANIISLEEAKHEIPKMGYFNTFSRIKSMKPKKEMRIIRTKPVASQTANKKVTKSVNYRFKAPSTPKIEKELAQQRLDREQENLSLAQQYRRSLIKNGIRPVKISHRQFKCNICSEAFEKEMLVWRHGAKHLSQKPFECSYCPKSFNRMDSLQRHVKNFH